MDPLARHKAVYPVEIAELLNFPHRDRTLPQAAAFVPLVQQENLASGFDGTSTARAARKHEVNK
jgi:hypothetical protein